MLRNDGGNQNNLPRMQMVGSNSNRDGIGARITVKIDDRTRFRGVVKTGSSYCSQNELPVTFGLGAAQAASIEVVWPSGRIDTIKQTATHQTLTIQEGKGIIAARCAAELGC